jgi:hypothetical protein
MTPRSEYLRAMNGTRRAIMPFSPHGHRPLPGPSTPFVTNFIANFVAPCASPHGPPFPPGAEPKQRLDQPRLVKVTKEWSIMPNPAPASLAREQSDSLRTFYARNVPPGPANSLQLGKGWSTSVKVSKTWKASSNPQMTFRHFRPGVGLSRPGDAPSASIRSAAAPPRHRSLTS